MTPAHEAAFRHTVEPLVLDAVRLHERLVRAGLYRTGHAMHEVVRLIGYEIADVVTGKQGVP